VTLHRSEESEIRTSARRSDSGSEMEIDCAHLVVVLADLYQLLEQHAPMWYTREHHEKAASALRWIRKS